MLAYFTKRLLLFIPSLLALSVLFFFLSKATPGDPALNRLESSMLGNENRNMLVELESLTQLKTQLGLNEAQFYFSIIRNTKSDTSYRISNALIKFNLNELAYQAASWPLSNAYFSAWKQEIKNPDLSDQNSSILNQTILQNSIHSIDKLLNQTAPNQLTEIKKAVEDLKKGGNWWNNFIPNFSWNGTNNQYHSWLSNLFKGNLGTSYSDGTSVGTKVWQALKNTLLLSLVSIFLAFVLAIPLAIKSAAKPDSLVDKVISISLLSFYALPVFWIATLLIIYFAGGDYLNWFPTYGLGEITSDQSIWQSIHIRIAHLILPVFCLTYGALAVIYKQLKNAMIQQLNADYVTTAYAKGLSKNSVVYKHAFKNASFPLITLLGKALPAVVSGAFVVEFIFSINGIGKLTLDAFLARDFPVIFGVLMLASFMTLLGVWLADIAYHIIDPRVSLQTNKHKA